MCVGGVCVCVCVRACMLRAMTDEEVISDSEKEDEESGEDTDGNETSEFSASTIDIPSSIVDEPTSKGKEKGKTIVSNILLIIIQNGDSAHHHHHHHHHNLIGSIENMTFLMKVYMLQITCQGCVKVT